jgi:hypothetical protein
MEGLNHRLPQGVVKWHFFYPNDRQSVCDRVAARCSLMPPQANIPPYGGKTVSYANFGTATVADSATEQQQTQGKEQESTLRVVTSDWQVEAELFTCQGQSRPVTTEIDGNGVLFYRQQDPLLRRDNANRRVHTC